MALTDFITLNFSGNKSAFARHMEVNPQQVTKWINDEWIVINGKLYAPRRDIAYRHDESLQVPGPKPESE